MPAEITMPQLSDTMTEGTLVKWRKKEGDKVKSGEVIAEIETDKATMEMEAYESGTLAYIAVKEGEKVAVGTAIAILATGRESAADVKRQLQGGPKSSASHSGTVAPPARNQTPKIQMQNTAASSAASAVAVAEAPTRGEIREPDEVGHHATREPATPVPPIPGGHGGNGHSRMKISPLAKRIATENSLDLGQISGSGPNGRIIQRDVLAFLERPATAIPTTSEPIAPAPEVARPPRGQTVLIPLTKMRATIATRLQQAKQQIPHFYTTMDVDVEEVSNLRVRLNQQLESEKIRLSLGDFVAKAVAVTLTRHPALNSTFDGQQITRHGGVNLGMAVALPDGLIVPVLRGVDQMGLKEIRTRSADLVNRARAQRLRRDELSGATFSVSNLGTYGLREFSAIINPPEVGILAVAAAEKRAVVRNDAIVPRTTMTLTLSADHRAVDGATAADFLRTLKHLLEDPGMMLV